MARSEKFFIHPKSVNNNVAGFEFPYLVYHEKIKTSRPFVVDSTMSAPYALLFFGGELKVDGEKQQIAVDDWIKLSAPARIAVLARAVRQQLDELLKQKIADPHYDISAHPLIGAVTKLLASDGVVQA